MGIFSSMGGFSHCNMDESLESCKSSVTNVDDVDELMKMKIQSMGMGAADQQNTHTYGIMHIALSLSTVYILDHTRMYRSKMKRDTTTYAKVGMGTGMILTILQPLNSIWESRRIDALRMNHDESINQVSPLFSFFS